MDLTDAIAIVEKSYKGALSPVSLDSIDLYDHTIFRSWGCQALDWITGSHSERGGLPRGRIVEIAGPESSGKTTTAIIAAVSVQKMKKANKVLILDYEHKLSLPYCVSLGLDPAKTLFVQPKGSKSGEAGLQLMIEALDADDCGLIIVDSVAQISSSQELEGDLTDSNIGAAARLQSKAIKKANEKITNGSPTIILINQLRANIGGYGGSEIVTGARAIKFAAAIRIDIRARQKIEDDAGNIIGQEIDLKAVKCQTSRPFLKETINLYFGQGYDNTAWLVGKGEELGLITVAHKTKEKPRGIHINYNNGTDLIRVDNIDIEDYFSVKRNFQSFYCACIQKNNQRLSETAKDLRGRKHSTKSPSPRTKEKPKESTLNEPEPY